MWLVDAYRIYFWLQSYTIAFIGKAEDTILLDVKSMKILQHLRDAVYKAMAPARQINKKMPTISLLSCNEQEEKAAKKNVVKSYNVFCANKPISFVVTKDRLLMHKKDQNGLKHEWTDVFLKDLQGHEKSTPAGECVFFTVMICFWFLNLYDNSDIHFPFFSFLS